MLRSPPARPKNKLKEATRNMSGSHFLTSEELQAYGFAHLGKHILIDRTVRIHGASRIEIGSNVRIDAYGVISAGANGISIGDYIHIGTHLFMAGAGRIEMHDFSGLSGKVSIYSSNDDYHGDTLTNPTIPDEFRNVTSAPVIIGRHVIVGAGSVILPGVTLHEGASVGALTLVRKDVPAFSIIAGQTGKVVGERKRNLLELEKQLRAKSSG
jgi:acetyltransferase-like isoleucine patch superfamily enzyme